jgi:ubiquinone biosynthesis protein
MLREAFHVARDLERIHEIASVLIRYGFGDIVHRLGLGHLLEQAGRVLHWKDGEVLTRLEPPERVCRMLEMLGPTFVKLGQVLASRVDLFSPEWIAAFERLVDQVPAVAFETLRAQLEEDLSAPPEQIFARLDTTPLAAGSIAQVHRAELADGTAVVLKIRRPGIRSKIEADLRLLSHLAEIAGRELPEVARYRPREVVRQFTLSLRRELDLGAEARNMERFAASFKDDPTILIPQIYWQWTCERINVQEYVAGIPGRDIEAVEHSGLNRRLLAKCGANAVLKMILIDGFFHADPHPGNVFYLPENRIAFLDFGMVGRLSQVRREQVIDLLYAMVNKDAESTVEVLLDWAQEAPIDTEALAIEVDRWLDTYHGVPLKRLHLSAVLGNLTTLMRDHQLALPPDLALLFKAFITLEGLGRQLDPEFDMAAHTAPFLSHALARRYTPEVMIQRGWRNTSELLTILASLPRDIRRLLRVWRHGSVQINVDMPRLEYFGHQIDRAASRLTVGMVTASLIVATAIAMTVSLSWFAVIGFLGAGAGGIWLLLSIWRGERDKSSR